MVILTTRQSKPNLLEPTVIWEDPVDVVRYILLTDMLAANITVGGNNATLIIERRDNRPTVDSTQPRLIWIRPYGIFNNTEQADLFLNFEDLTYNVAIDIEATSRSLLTQAWIEVRRVLNAVRKICNFSDSGVFDFKIHQQYRFLDMKQGQDLSSAEDGIFHRVVSVQLTANMQLISSSSLSLSDLTAVAEDDLITSGQTLALFAKLNYHYDQRKNEWHQKRNSFRQATTGILKLGFGSIIDMRKSPLSKLSMSIIGQANGGTFSSCTVNLEVSLDGINWQKTLTLTLAAAGVESDESQFPCFYIRYNVIALSITGGADLDINLLASGR